MPLLNKLQNAVTSVCNRIVQAIDDGVPIRGDLHMEGASGTVDLMDIPLLEKLGITGEIKFEIKGKGMRFDFTVGGDGERVGDEDEKVKAEIEDVDVEDNDPDDTAPL